jgi:hypothetical protein
MWTDNPSTFGEQMLLKNEYVYHWTPLFSSTKVGQALILNVLKSNVDMSFAVLDGVSC